MSEISIHAHALWRTPGPHSVAQIQAAMNEHSADLQIDHKAECDGLKLAMRELEAEYVHRLEIAARLTDNHRSQRMEIVHLKAALALAEDALRHVEFIQMGERGALECPWCKGRFPTHGLACERINSLAAIEALKGGDAVCPTRTDSPGSNAAPGSDPSDAATATEAKIDAHIERTCLSEYHPVMLAWVGIKCALHRQANELADLRKDKTRLDAIIANHWQVRLVWDKWCVLQPAQQYVASADTPREAIDKAMEENK